MKTPVLETRRKVMTTVANAYPGGRDCAAARLGIPLKRLENQMYETAGVKPLSDGDLYVLEQEMGSSYLPDYICAMYGGIVCADAGSGRSGQRRPAPPFAAYSG
ncbi:hypothetical protein ACVG01_16985 [Pseudomonas aeruginosa]